MGRLDAETSGLLLLTNDGELAHVLAHPSFGVEKTYIAKVRGARDRRRRSQQLKKGVELEDGPIAADKARDAAAAGRRRGTSMVEITLHSGRNRIVRRMLDAVGHPVVELVRRQFGPLHLGTLRVGRTCATSLRWNSASCSRSRAPRTPHRSDGSGSTEGTRDRITPDRGPVRIVGAGLLGASIGLGLRARGVDVILADASPTHARARHRLRRRPRAPAADDAPQLIVVAVPPDVDGRGRRRRTRRASPTRS